DRPREVLLAPLVQRGTEPGQGTGRARAADPAIVEDDARQPAFGEEGGEGLVEAAGDAPGGCDDHRGPGRSRRDALLAREREPVPRGEGDGCRHEADTMTPLPPPFSEEAAPPRGTP